MSSKPIEKTPTVEGADPILLTARENLSQGNLPRALHAYGHLIKHHRLINEILPDLAQAVKQYPRDPQVWQTLGDALARAGNAEHAAQSYERARQLGQLSNSSESSTL